ncbi:type II toxin-antitoxin system HicA family toxin [Candidatus Poribacteria bacterium]|nr:type II toxin-antitoxin system HicA family toxin [Candidatus Poribacteria bacterium]
MKLRDLKQHLTEYQCYFVREGGNHTIWGSPHSNVYAKIPRHRNIAKGTVHKICKELNIPNPKSLT